MCDIAVKFWNKGVQPVLSLSTIIWAMATQIHIVKQPEDQGEGITDYHMLGIIICLVPMLLVRVGCLIYRTNVYWNKHDIRITGFEESPKVFIAYASTAFIIVDVVFGVLFLIFPMKSLTDAFSIDIVNAVIYWDLLFIIGWLPLMLLTALVRCLLKKYVWTKPLLPLSLWGDGDGYNITYLNTDKDYHDHDNRSYAVHIDSDTSMPKTSYHYLQPAGYLRS